MRKLKMVSTSLAILLLFLVAYPTSNEAANMTININGLKQNFKPITVDNRTLVPLRGIFEEFGATVHWDPKTKVITAFNTQSKIILKPSSRNVRVNDRLVLIDVPALTRNNTTYVPLRFISEAFGAYVEWNGKSNSINISYVNISGLLGEWLVTYDNDNKTYTTINITRIKDGHVEGTYGKFNRRLEGTIQGNKVNFRVYDNEASIRYWLKDWAEPQYAKEVIVTDLTGTYKNQAYSSFNIIQNLKTKEYFVRWVDYGFDHNSDYHVTSVHLDYRLDMNGEMKRIR